MSEPPAEGATGGPREAARQAESRGDWQLAESLWRRIPDDDEARKAIRRLEEKRRIFGKIESMLPGGGQHSYIGLDDRVTVVHDGIELRFHLRLRDLDLGLIVGALRRARLKFEERLGYRLDVVPVDLHRTREEMQAASGPGGNRPADWAVATASDRIRIALDGPEGREGHRLLVTLTHEFSHLAMRALTSGRCPRWLDEGVAVALSQELPAHYRTTLSEALSEDRCLPLADLSQALSAGGDSNPARLAYAQAASIVEFLLAEHGWAGMREFLQRIAREDFESVLKRRSMSSYLLERAWARWARTNVDVSKPRPGLENASE